MQDNPQPVPQPAPLPPTRDPVTRWWRGAGPVQRVIGVVVIVTVVACCWGSIGVAANLGGKSSANASATNTVGQVSQATKVPAGPTATRGPTATATPSYAHFGDGTYQVGKDIQPGTYRTRSASPDCYFERLKSFDGSLDSIISNSNEDGPAIVTIAKTDVGFHSERCGTWTANLTQITSSKTTFDEGMYFVNVDIAPGTYKNDPGNDSCYWERLSNFSGGLNGIIANDNASAQAIVTIRASDKGFASERCGTWHKI